MSGRDIARAFLAAALAAFLAGCAVVTNRYALEEPFTDDGVARIRNGVTTRAEILDRLGPPDAVRRTGTTTRPTQPPPEAGDGWDSAMDNALGRFAAAAGGEFKPLVYGYRATERGWETVVLCGQGACAEINSTPVRRTRMLYLLIDESTTKVVDHLLEETRREEPGQERDPWAP